MKSRLTAKDLVTVQYCRKHTTPHLYSLRLPVVTWRPASHDQPRGQGADLLETRGWDDLASGVIEVLVFLVEFLSDGGDMAQLELGEAPAAPALCSADERAEHEFEHRLFAEAVGDDFEPSPLLDEQPFKQVGRPGEAPQ